MSSKSFPNTAHLPSSFVIIAFVPKNSPKVDVFGSTKFYSAEDVAKLAEEGTTVVEGQPKSSVLDQGTTTFGKDSLIPMLQEVYGFEFNDNTKFVDLSIVLDSPLKTDDGNYFIPKPVTRGERKGQMEVVVRKDIEMYPLVLAEDLIEEDAADVEETVVEEANVPEIDMTGTSKPSLEPTIEDIIDEDDNLVEVEGEQVDLDIQVDPIEEEAEEAEEEALESTEEDTEEEDDDFGDLSI